MKYSLILLVATLALLTDINAQTQIDTVHFSPEQLREDANYYFGWRANIHPNLYYYCCKEVYEKKREEILQQLNHPMTRGEFIMVIATINPCLDDHSGFNIFDSSPLLFKWLKMVDNKGDDIFPKVSMKDGKIFTKIDGKPKELLAINDVKVQNILDLIMKYQTQMLVRLKEKNIESSFAVWISAWFDIHSPFEITYKKKTA